MPLGDHASWHTWLPVSTVLSRSPVLAFQKRMHLSAVPPPDARRPDLCGHHESAFTAAQCCEKRCSGTEVSVRAWSSVSPAAAALESAAADQMQILLSLPPDARSCPSWDHSSPHTWWGCEFVKMGGGGVIH